MIPISSHNKHFPLGILIGLTLALAFSLLAFSEPTLAPPGCTSGTPGCDAPLNVGIGGQSKTGGLILGTGAVTTGLIVQNGNVGIGTTIPAERLHVLDNIAVQLSGAAARGLKFRTSTADGRGEFLTVLAGHDASPNGNVSLDIQNQLNSGRTGIDLMPTAGTLPTTQALDELVLYRTTDKVTNFERLNFSAMANPADGGYRIGQEFAGTGVRRDIVLAQENGVTAGTEVFLRIGERDGDSQRIQLENAHLRFETASRGGVASTYWIGRGGGATINYNVPTGAEHQFLGNNATVMTIQAGGNVGIGTAAPGSTLTIRPSTAGTTFAIRNTADTANTFAIDDTGTITSGSVPWARLTSFPIACPSGQFVTAVGGTLMCATPPGGGSGTVTSLTEGFGIDLTPDTITTTGSIAVNTGIIQRRVGGTCVSQVMTGINVDGTVSCETDDTGSGGVTGGGTANWIPRWSGGTSLTNSSIYNDGFTTEVQSGDFKLNGSAYGRGAGGRALVHDVGNILAINYAGDFTGGTIVHGSSGISASTFRDRDNGSYYVDPNGVSVLSTLCLSGTCRTSWPAGGITSESDTLQNVTDRGRSTSQWIQSPRFEDRDNAGYYLDPASDSWLWRTNVWQVNADFFTDKNNPGYSMDPGGSTFLNWLRPNTLCLNSGSTCKSNWDSITSTNNAYSLVMQGDRNIVGYGPSGPFWASNTNISDRRLKRDITELDGSLDRILKLRGVRFFWNEEWRGEEPQIGMIAQEVENVFPELVSSVDGLKGIKYESLIAHLIEAIKTQEQEIKELQEEINAIRSQ